jgi:hypothetical protein
VHLDQIVPAICQKIGIPPETLRRIAGRARAKRGSVVRALEYAPRAPNACSTAV